MEQHAPVNSFVRNALAAGIQTKSLVEARRAIDAPLPTPLRAPVAADVVEGLAHDVLAGRVNADEVNHRLALADAGVGYLSRLLRDRVQQLVDVEITRALDRDRRSLQKAISDEHESAKRAFHTAEDALRAAGVRVPRRDENEPISTVLPIVEQVRMNASGAGSAALKAFETWEASRSRLRRAAAAWSSGVAAGLLSAPADARRVEVVEVDGAFTAA